MKFEVQNFKSFKDKFVFDLSQTKNYEFNGDCINNNLVNKALIYGVNGCGKSNLGLAIFDLTSHITDKTKVPALYANFLNAESTENMAVFTYHFKFEESTLEYSYGKTTFGLVNWESLKVNGKNVVTYQRGTPFVSKLIGTETLNNDLGDSGLAALKYIKSNAKLSADKVNSTVLSFLKFVDEMLFFRSLMGPEFNYMGYSTKFENILEYILNNNHLDDFEIFLNEAGILCKLESIVLNGIVNIVFSFGDKKVGFWDAASTGTKSLTLFYYWLKNAQDRSDLSFVFIDEFDAYYHHKLSELIVKKLKDIAAQVVLTTHNTSIMTNDLLRPDCYFLMQNNKIDPLYKFTEKELRFAHNIEKMYKAGAFNA